MNNSNIVLILLLVLSLTIPTSFGDGCFPPALGDWIVTQNCTLGIDGTVNNGNLIVRNNSVLTIDDNTSLGIDFTKYNLSVEDGSGVLIKNGGNIQATDVDGDSIDNRIDLEPKIYSDDFSNNQSPRTYGSIVNRGDQPIHIFPDGDKIRWVASPNLTGGSDALIKTCENNVLTPLLPSTDSSIKCGSIDIQVNSGAVDVVLDSNNNFTSTVTAILDESDSFFFDEESFTMRSNAGTAEITIIAEDGTTIEVTLEEDNSITVDPETAIITADPDNTTDVVIVVDGGEEETIPPGMSVAPSPGLPDDFGIIELFCGQPVSYYDNIINGTSGSDYLVGTNNADLILGYAGNDSIRGLRGDDCIYAGDDNDFIQGGRGNDMIHAGDGDDVVITGRDSDMIFGENGNDILHATSKKGFNTLDGGNGTDICVPQSSKVKLTTINCEITN